MRRNKIIKLLLYIFITIFMLIPLGEVQQARAATISISKQSMTLAAGRYRTLYICGTTRTVTWSSSNTAVATVSSSGRVTAKAVGTATITASVAGKKLYCKVTVIKLSNSAITLSVGGSKTLKVYGTTSTVTWSSSNTAVATVSSLGTVKAKAYGTATITASVAGVKMYCKVTAVKLSNSVITLTKGTTKTLKVYGATGTVTWYSSNTAVATVSSLGTVTAKSAGTAGITASVGGIKLVCTVTVNNPAATPTPAPTIAPTQSPTPTPTQAPISSLSINKRVVGYYAAWAKYAGFSPSQINAGRLTHINYAFANISSDLKLMLGYPDVDATNISQLNALKQTNPNLKTIISVGGWTWSGRFSDAALTEASRNTFADSCVNFIVKYGFDGIDIDWEYPVRGGLSTNVRRPEDKQNFTLLMQTLRDKLDARGTIDGKHYILTFAGAAGGWYLNSVEISKLSQIVDYANVMTYDLHGSWDQYTDFNAPLYNSTLATPNYPYSVDTSIKGWMNAGFDKSKLVMGVPFYGYIYKSVNNAGSGLFQTYSGCSSISYNNIAGNYLNSTKFIRYFDTKAMVPWLFDGSTFISYEDEQSMKAKAEYIKNNGLGGAMIWELSQDPKSVLLNALYQNISE